MTGLLGVHDARASQRTAPAPRWSDDDFTIAAEPVRLLQDFWADAVPPMPQAPVSLASAAVAPPAAFDAPVDHPSSRQEAEPPARTERADGLAPLKDMWSDGLASSDWIVETERDDVAFGEPIDVDLPLFDPGASTAPSSDVFARPYRSLLDVQARLLARETGIIRPQGRADAARIFHDALAEERWPRLVHSWSMLAPEVDCPRVLALAFALRELWEESPSLWRHRRAPNRVGTYHPALRDQFSWRRALAIAQAAPHEPAEALLSEDWLADWEELADPAPGYWSFADYVELRATADEAESHQVVVAIQLARSRRALHMLDGCHHLGRGRSDPVRSIDGYLETGVRARPVTGGDHDEEDK